MNRRARIRERQIIYARTRMGSITYKVKRKWSKRGFVTDLTGWDHEKLRQAREQNLITWEERGKGIFWYDINSIPERFLIKK
jgi:hypothetical protein